MEQKKVKWQLVEMERYDQTLYMLKQDGLSIKAFTNYEEACREFNIAVNFVEKDTILMEVEI